MSVNEEHIEKLDYLSEGHIYITTIAFNKMLQHVFKYGNDAAEEKQEVMGLCLGNKDNSIKVIDVVPITHGDNVELGFSKEIHDIINKINNESLAKGLSVTGWYHSHLGYGTYLSNSDRVNHLNFQNQENPLGFAIVFDYKLAEPDKNYGLEIFRFKDYLKGPESPYGKVKYEIEKPNTLDYFKWIKGLVEDSQRKIPIIIKEYNEINKITLDELQEIPSPKENVIMEEKDEIRLQMEEVINKSHEGMVKFNQILGEKVLEEFSIWLNTLYNGSLRGIEQIRSIISQMRKTVLDGFEDVDNYFSRSFKDISEIFIKDVSGYLDKAIENQKDLKTSVDKNLQNFNSETLTMVNDKIEGIKTEINEKVSHNEVKIHNINQISSQMKPVIEKLKLNLNSLHKGLDSITDVLKEDIEKSCSSFQSNLKMELESINLNSDSIIEKYKEIQGLIERLQKVISEFRQFK